ncbi:hypothetical protein KFK09_010133 [Dendrobium nobile]|uniref:Uncharacterized protein n=1 Tax=Dendrobium nobile TaxID=94219 RepID=A0A8T3BN18_DENNO|nr:hypothetical protein KFK09_010133 [Dendrobium nobile]
MAEWFVGPIMDKIINACYDYLEEQVGWQTGMKKELESLRENHPKIQAVVDFAVNKAQISDQNPALNKWIWKLRDAIDEANDVLDEFEYMKHKQQLIKNTEETKKRKVTSFLFESARKIVKIGERVLKMDPNLKRLEEAVQKLDKVSADVTTFLHLIDSAKQEYKEQEVDFYKTRETGYLPKNDLIGRGKDKEVVMEWLRNPSNEHRGADLYRNISLLSIVGHGGMGKTTLLQHVYKDEITKEFDLTMWVCVSNNFDVKKVIADMLQSLKMERPRCDTLDALQRRLEEEVMSKKFLLVLDDIWEEDEENDKSKWEDVLAPLASGGFGSKIMVTTRTDAVALMFAKVIKKKKEIVKLEGLEEDACLQLLNSHAFAVVENPSDDHKKLREIAGEIVKKLLGSPLVAKVIGGVLNDNLDERHWRKVLESNLLGQNSMNSILRLSYIVLPNHLQNCFAFCCMFRQDDHFDKDDLVRMWIALGFIQPSLDQEETMEDIGGRYFDVLVKKSFFEKCMILLHELARSVSIQEYLRVEDSIKLPSIIPETLRHLSIQTPDPDILRKIEKFKHLHSLFLLYEDSNQNVYSTLIEIFNTSRCLRLLYICIGQVKLKMIPEEIGNLIHLRYLDIDGYGLTMLPRSLSNLYHLQSIICWVQSQHEVDDFLPSDINILSNLHYVKLPKNYISSICGIGKLKSLQELNMFDLRDVSGYRIGELENMKDLCKLGINCLENVKDAAEACSAELCAKRRLTDLTLCWSTTYSMNIDLYENVLDNLQPPKCLRNLSIERYMGVRSAIWMNNVNPIFNLENIKLQNCSEWETLPAFGQLPFLKSLTLSEMPKVKWLESKFNGNDTYRAFPLLEILHIRGLIALEDWFEAGVAAEDGCLFPCLIELKLLNCPKLKELPSLPPKLERLVIEEIGWTTLNFCSSSNPIPLERLEVFHCPNITSLPLADEIARLAALRSLTIRNCTNLISLGRHREMQITNNCHLILEKIELMMCSKLKTLPPFGKLPFLKLLRLSNLPQVKWLESKFNGNDKYRAFPLLEKLYIWELDALEDWFEAGVAAEDGCLFPCLIELNLRNCPKLKELPSLPSKLKNLEIKGIGWRTLNFCSNSDPIPLEALMVLGCPNITSLPLADEIARLAALRYLTIIYCPNLISLGEMQKVETTNNRHLMLSALYINDPSVLLMEPLRSMASLKKLSIEDNDELVSFPNEAEQWFLKVRSSLSHLQFAKLKSLESLPSSLESLSSLQDLFIYDVPMLRELPNLPPSLRSLYIRNCHPELHKRYREDGALFLLLFTCSALTTSIVGAMAEFVVGPIMEKIINACSDYLKDQIGWQKGMKKELESLRENHPKIQAVVFAANEAQISDQNPAFNKWIWQLRDAIDEADDVLDDFEYTKHKQELCKNTKETKLTKNKKLRKVRSLMKSIKKRLVKIGERAVKIDPNLKRLEEAVQKLDKVSADVTNFIYLLDSTKQEQKEQEVDFYKARETESFPTTNYLIGRRKHKEIVMNWLRSPTNEPRETDLYRNISLLSIVGHGGMGKTTLLQHVYKNEITKEFDLKMWVCVSNNFDVKKVIADMLECLQNERPRLETLVALQRHVEEEVMSKKFLLVLDDIWEEEEEKDKNKWEDVLAPLSSGGFGSKILITTRTDSVALMFAKVLKKEGKIVKLDGLEEDDCLQLLTLMHLLV